MLPFLGGFISLLRFGSIASGNIMFYRISYEILGNLDSIFFIQQGVLMLQTFCHGVQILPKYFNFWMIWKMESAKKLDFLTVSNFDG